MLRKRVLPGLFLVVVLGIVSGCGEYEKLLKSRDFEQKYEKALEYYDEEEYVKAATLLDQVVNIYRGTVKADTVKYYQAKSYYAQRDYILAGHYFNQLATTYPSSAFLEEAEFMVGYCFYQMSPRPELDQENTFKAINAFQMFMAKHPSSDKIEQCQQLIREMNNKLVEKSFISARLYYDLGYYKAAIIALRNSLSDYPNTRYREDVMFLILKSSYLLADNSVATKRMERFQSTVDEYFSFNAEFPQSEHSKEAERIYSTSQKVLENYTNN